MALVTQPGLAPGHPSANHVWARHPPTRARAQRPLHRSTGFTEAKAKAWGGGAQRGLLSSRRTKKERNVWWSDSSCAARRRKNTAAERRLFSQESETRIRSVEGERHDMFGEREKEEELHLLSGVQNARQAAECTTGLIKFVIKCSLETKKFGAGGPATPPPVMWRVQP